MADAGLSVCANADLFEADRGNWMKGNRMRGNDGYLKGIQRADVGASCAKSAKHCSEVRGSEMWM